MGACDEALKWVGDLDLATAWAECENASWMLWYARRRCEQNSLLLKPVVQAACACARPGLKYVPKGEDWPRIAIETAEAWTRGEATIEQVYAAAHAAHAVHAAHAADAADAAALKEMADIVRSIITVDMLERR